MRAFALLLVAGCAAPVLPASVPGEVTIVQLRLPAGVTARPGEAAIVVGPDGTMALVDVGNSNHDDDVRDAVRALNSARGRPPLQVEWIVLTHFHGDHVGALPDLLGDEPIDLRRSIVHRGFVDVGAGANEDDVDRLRAFADRTVALCEGGRCTLPFTIDLGGATLTIVAANGHVTDGNEVHAMPAFGTGDHNEENARSLAGVIAHGPFRYHLGGDLTGGKERAPDVESHLVAVAGPRYFGALGVDVIHAHHHGRRTSSNAWLVDALAPRDGRSRNVVAGIGAAHLGSPHVEVLAAWADHLGQGRFWVTERAAGGATHDRLVDANGPVMVQTSEGGRTYRVTGGPLALEFPSLR